MSRLFQRKAVVAIGRGSIGEAVLIEGLRCAFKVTKTLDKAPNQLELTISNLSERQRASVQAKDVDLVLQAGFESNVEVIFSGQVRTADHKYEGSTWSTVIKSGDGERAYSQAHVSESFGEESPLMGAAMKVAEMLGIGPGNLEEQLGQVNGEGATLQTGYSAFGNAAKELEKLLGRVQLSYSIQEGNLLVLGPSAVAAGVAVVKLTPDTGLIGTPEMGTPGKDKGRNVLKCRALLQPAIKPGGKLLLESRSLRGSFRVERVTHQGDTHGSQWETELEATPL